MNRPTNQPTLRELLRPIAAHRFLLIAVIAIAIGASIAYSSSKTPVYTAQASIAYHDESYDLGLVGLAVTPTQTADQLASAGAQTIIQPSVATRVKRALNSPLSTGALTGAVSATVQPSSNLVAIQASAATPVQARDIANAFAAQGAAATNLQVRAVYADAYHAALKQISRRGAPAPNSTTQAVDSDQLSRLLVLSSIASAAQVVDPAQLPPAPTSPRPLRDAALAGVLGLVLGLLAVYIRDSFDRRLRTLNDIEEQFALPLLGHVRTEALGRSPCVNGDQGAAAVDWELFRILRRNLDFLEPNQPIRSVAVTSSLPDEGKSTVAAFLAFTSAAAGKRTLLIECDLRRPVLADRLGINEAPGLSDFVIGHATPAEILQVVRFGDPISVNGAGGPDAATEANGAPPTADDGSPQRYMHELVCITAGTRTQHPVELLRSDALGEMLRQVRDAYDLVVLDTPPLLSVVDTLELLPHVEAAVVCVRVFSTTRHQAGAGKAALRRLPERPTGLVVTGTRRAAEAEYGYYGYYT